MIVKTAAQESGVYDVPPIAICRAFHAMSRAPNTMGIDPATVRRLPATVKARAFPPRRACGSTSSPGLGCKRKLKSSPATDQRDGASATAGESVKA
jgi:hypothetical protein